MTHSRTVLLTCTLALEKVRQLPPGLLQVPLLPISSIPRRPTPAAATAAAEAAALALLLLLLSVAVAAICSTDAAQH